jgi:hypothetical protein
MELRDVALYCLECALSQGICLHKLLRSVLLDVSIINILLLYAIRIVRSHALSAIDSATAPWPVVKKTCQPDTGMDGDFFTPF